MAGIIIGAVALVVIMALILHRRPRGFSGDRGEHRTPGNVGDGQGEAASRLSGFGQWGGWGGP